MDMAIDESGDDGKTPAVDADSPFGNSDLAAETGRHDLCAAHEERRVVLNRSGSVDEAHVMDSNRHDLPSLL
jgi:hypothetical protein